MKKDPSICNKIYHAQKVACVEAKFQKRLHTLYFAFYQNRFKNIKNIKNRYLVAVVVFLFFGFQFWNCRFLLLDVSWVKSETLVLFFYDMFFVFHCLLTQTVMSTFTANTFVELFFHCRAAQSYRISEETVYQFWLSQTLI